MSRKDWSREAAYDAPKASSPVVVLMPIELGGSPLDAVLWWIDRGFLPVPVYDKSKKPFNPDHPKGKEWEKLRITPQTAAHYFNGGPQNFGVLTGDDFGSADVDLDCPEAVNAAAHYLPDTGLRFGRASNPSSDRKSTRLNSSHRW